MIENKQISNLWNSGSSYAGRYENLFEYDANGNITTQIRKDAVGNTIDNLTYQYAKVGGKLYHNRLYHLNDNVSSSAFDDDIDDMGTFGDANLSAMMFDNNYVYDAIGNLIKDQQEEIDSMKWRPDGKLEKIVRSSSSGKLNLKFDYDVSGNRIAKHVIDNNDELLHSTYYVRDAQGNVMSVYKLNIDTVQQSLAYFQKERHIYGSSMLGMDTDSLEMIGASVADTTLFSYLVGNKRYQMSNHLGNVLAVISDKKLPVEDSGLVSYYLPEIVSTSDYSPFGVELDGRGYNPNTKKAENIKPDFLWTFEGGNLAEKNGSGHDALKYQNPTLIDDRCDEEESAYMFSGSFQYIKINDHADFDPGTDDFTVAIWAKKITHNRNHAGTAVNKWNTGGLPGTNEWSLNLTRGRTGNESARFYIESDSTEYIAASNVYVNLNQWYHLVGIRDGDTLRIYVDGQEEGKTYIGNVAVNNSGRDIFMARVNGIYGNIAVDEFAYYKKALSPEEVQTLYNGVGCNMKPLASQEGDYRYGFNGQEKDDEVKGKGNSVNFKYRMHDPRVGRFFAVDPLSPEYQELTPYQFASNTPIWASELEGLEAAYTISHEVKVDKNGNFVTSQLGAPKLTTTNGNWSGGKMESEFFFEGNVYKNQGEIPGWSNWKKSQQQEFNKGAGAFVMGSASVILAIPTGGTSLGILAIGTGTASMGLGGFKLYQASDGKVEEYKNLPLGLGSAAGGFIGKQLGNEELGQSIGGFGESLITGTGAIKELPKAFANQKGLKIAQGMQGLFEAGTSGYNAYESIVNEIQNNLNQDDD